MLLSTRAAFPVVAALALVAVACLDYLFAPPGSSPAHARPLEALELGVFSITALLINRVMDRARRSDQRVAERARLLDLTHDAVFSHDMENRIFYWNRGAERLYGWSAAEVLGRPLHELRKVPESAADGNARELLLQTGSWQGDLFHVTRDGTRIVVAVRGLLERDDSGNPVAVHLTMNDITERKQAEDWLRASQERFRTLVDHATDGIYLHGEDGVLIHVNRQACDSLGYTRDELIGMSAFDIDPDLDPVAIGKRFEAGEPIVTFESRNRRKDGTTVPVEVRTRGFTSPPTGVRSVSRSRATSPSASAPRWRCGRVRSAIAR